MTGLFGGRRSASGGNDAHRLVITRTLLREGHMSGHFCEQRVVAPHADVRPGMHLGAALAHDDGAGADQLAAIALHAEPLRLRVAAVTRAADCFFMCHYKSFCSLMWGCTRGISPRSSYAAMPRISISV